MDVSDSLVSRQILFQIAEAHLLQQLGLGTQALERRDRPGDGTGHRTPHEAPWTVPLTPDTRKGAERSKMCSGSSICFFFFNGGVLVVLPAVSG